MRSRGPVLPPRRPNESMLSPLTGGSESRWHGRSFVLSLALSTAFLLGVLPATRCLAAGVQSGGNSPPFVLSVDELLAWTPFGPLADRRNVSSVGLAPRFTDPAMDPEQKARPDPSVRILIAPDGMNDLGSDLEPQPRFNLYTFTHWSQVDLLTWFGGTADKTIVIPARPWVDAAHRNGVKVIGTVFFAPAAWGGSPGTLRSFLRQRPDGSFAAAEKLVEIARDYGFDGWLINAETGLGPGAKPAAAGENGVGRTMADFMAYLKRITPRQMEIIWYDAMITDGSIAYQNALDEKNLKFFEDGNTRTSDGIFLNYDWTRAGLLKSAELAQRVGRSRYDIFIGADLWPLRNAQRAFQNTKWLSELREAPGGRALGSIALFAPNFNYHVEASGGPQFGDFKNNPADVGLFYKTEERLFAGDAMNMAEGGGRSSSGSWPGIGTLVSSRSTLMALPFTTYFNTGHGVSDYRKGHRIGGAWHDMSRQDVLPTWQFAFSPGAAVEIGYDFEDAYEGGSSLRLALPRQPAGKVEVPLYLAHLPVGRSIRVATDTRTKMRAFSLRLDLSDGKSIELSVEPGGTWRSQVRCVDLSGAKFIRRIAIVARPQVQGAARSELLLGGLSIENNCTEQKLQRN